MNLAAKTGWVDRLPAATWLAVPAIALAPIWSWVAARLLDRSDDPLGAVALAAAALLVARERARFRETPRIGWLAVMTALAAAAILGAGVLPTLARGVLAVLAMCAALMAVRAPVQPMLALAGLALLALPLLSSLQFFIGYPLRVITAETSRLIFSALGVAAERDGSTLSIGGRLVVVDAPCAGIHMGWVAYFTACVAAAWWRVPDYRFARRVPLTGVIVLAGNIVRNTLLVTKEAGLVQWPDWTHAAIGVATFALVCALVLRHMAGAADARVVTWELRLRGRRAPAISLGTWARLCTLAVFAVLTIWTWLRPAPVLAEPPTPAIEWPREFEGRRLQPLALSAVEQRFADRFPGAIARFTDGVHTIVLRYVAAPTRMLHPAADCYRGLGYRVLSMGLERAVGDAPDRALRRCFVADKGGVRLRVCENIVDAAGRVFTDTSAWYWAAVTGRSRGPWRAVVEARML